ncbi:MAG: YncE family protein [Acidimicrobiales bacterium]
MRRTIILGDAFPQGLGVDPRTGTVYLANESITSDPTVSVIDEKTDRVTHTIHLEASNSPSGLAVDPTTGTVYETNYDGNSVTVINEKTDKVARTIDVGLNP